MNVISKRGLHRLLKGKSSEVADALLAWFKTASGADWATLQDVRQCFPDVGQVGEVLVFHIRHNRYRLIVTVFYPARTIHLKVLLTHKEYDRGEWKKWA